MGRVHWGDQGADGRITLICIVKLIHAPQDGDQYRLFFGEGGVERRTFGRGDERTGYR